MHSSSAIGWRSVEVVWELFDTPTYIYLLCFGQYCECKRAGRSTVPVCTEVTSVLSFRTVQTDSRGQRVPNSIGNGGPFPEVNQPGLEVDHSHSSQGVIKSECGCNSTSIVDKGQLYLHLCKR